MLVSEMMRAMVPINAFFALFEIPTSRRMSFSPPGYAGKKCRAESKRKPLKTNDLERSRTDSSCLVEDSVAGLTRLVKEEKMGRTRALGDNGAGKKTGFQAANLKSQGAQPWNSSFRKTADQGHPFPLNPQAAYQSETP